MIAKKLLFMCNEFGDSKLQESRCMNLKNFFYTILISTLLTFLTGCPSNQAQLNDYDGNKSSSYYLSLADQSSGNVKTNWHLLAIQALIKENKVSQAKDLLSQLSSDLNDKQQKEKLLLQGEIAVKSGKSFNIKQLNSDELTNSQLYRYYFIKLSLDEKNRDVNGQAHDYIELEKYIPANQKKQLLNDTWKFFSKLSSKDINAILVYEDEITLQGWINLTDAYKRNSIELKTQEDDTPEIITEKVQKQSQLLKQAVNDWLIQYPDHPAKNIISVLTGEPVLNVDDANAKKVALLLPLTGSSRIFGDTIRQGYFDAIKFFPQEPQQSIVLLDTTSTEIDVLLRQAKEQNVELIVGPLLKDEVIKIKQLSPSLPVLALNKVDNSSTTASKMCYFALSPEDEAQDAADHIYAQNKLKPLLLVPQNDLGQRVAQSFAKKWSELSSDSSQAYVQYFGNKSTLSSGMNRDVGITLTGTPILTNNTEDQSDNFDAVYIYASYDELTLIKPMIDMAAGRTVGNSSSLMIYTSSKSHVANASEDFNYDMNHTEYAEIPMIVNYSDNVSEMIPHNIKKNYSLMRLYAMGIDAWRLANRFNQINSYQTDFLNGMTGELSTKDQCEVTRALSWQQYTHVSSKSNSQE